MDRLSQETVDLITAFAIGSKGLDAFSKSWHRHPGRTPSCASLTTLAAINTRWQYAAERYNFSDLIVTSTEEDIQSLRDFCVRNVRRRQHLKTLRIHLVVPDSDGQFFFEQKADTLAFNEALKRVFGVLKVWDNDLAQGASSEKQGLSIIFEDIYPPKRLERHRHHRKGDLSSYNLHRQEGASLRRRERYFSLHLLPESLPQLKFVDKIEFQGSMRELAMGTCFQIASKLPGLEALNLGLVDDNTGRALTLQRQMRIGLGDVLRLTDSRRLQSAEIVFLSDFPINLSEAAPDLVSPLTQDPLSAGLRDFSRNLTSLTIAGLLDLNFFNTPQNREPYWPNLERLDLGLYLRTPSGKRHFDFYAKTDHLVDENLVNQETPLHPEVIPNVQDEYDIPVLNPVPSKFRMAPNNEHLRPLLLSFAAAASNQMPALKSAVVGVRENARTNHWEVRWTAPGQYSPRDKQAGCTNARRRLQFMDMPDWRPDDELLGELKMVGEERYNDYVEVYYLPIALGPKGVKGNSI